MNWKLISGGYEVCVSPGSGRIVFFGEKGGANALWENPGGTDVGGWKNFGGEKVWLWPQEGWSGKFGTPWPPPYDGCLWEGNFVGNSGEWQLSLAPVYDALIYRRATIEGNKLVVRTEMIGDVGPFRLWSITQIERPEFLKVPTESDRAFPNPFPVFSRTDGAWFLKEARAEGGKWFFDGDQIVACTPAGLLSITNSEQMTVDPMSPIEQVQIYFDYQAPKLRPAHLPPYVELEFLAVPGSSVLELTFQLSPSPATRELTGVG